MNTFTAYDMNDACHPEKSLCCDQWRIHQGGGDASHRHRYANVVPVKQPLVTNLYLSYYNNAAKSEVKQQTTIQVLFGLRCLASCYNQKRFLLKMHKKAFRDQARCPGLQMELTALPRSPGLKGEGSAGKGGKVEGSPPTTDSWISHWLGCNRTVEIKAVRNTISDSCILYFLTRRVGVSYRFQIAKWIFNEIRLFVLVQLI